jgi:hypothetical protein
MSDNSGASCGALQSQPWPLAPSRRRQTICIVQIAGLNLAILPAIPPSATGMLAAVALGALACSFVADVAWLWRQEIS